MLVLISETVHRDHGSRLASVAPHAQWLRLQPDGSLVLDGVVVDADAVAPDVAFISNDVFYGPVAACFALLESWGSLRWVQSAAAGTEAPLYRSLIGRGCRITRAHVTAVPIAEYVLRAVLTHLQQPQRLVDQQRAHLWQHQPFREVWKTTWMVIGLGAIGGEVAKRAQAFGARVIGVRRTPQGDEPVDEMVAPSEIVDRAGEADVVVLAAAGGDETRNMINREVFSAMKPGSVFVNVARGYMVDEVALLAALGNNAPEVAILDVFATEPLPADSVFWDHPQVVVSPHSSGGGNGRVQRAVDVFVENLGRWNRAEPMVHEITEADLPRVPETWVTEKR
jgi:phosphoglycerate dehydrogenase-like enzyme